MILDLDGTILSVNSFRIWSWYILRGRFPNLGGWRCLCISFTALCALLSRRLRLSSHNRLKWKLQRLWQTATKGDGGQNERRLINQLAAFVRPELSGVLHAISCGKVDAVMATAAAGDYAHGFGQSLGFVHVLATPAERGASDHENIGARKLESVLDFMHQRGWHDRPRLLFTDHRDDLPLVQACETVIWFGSSTELAQMTRRAPRTRILAGSPVILDSATRPAFTGVTAGYDR